MWLMAGLTVWKFLKGLVLCTSFFLIVDEMRRMSRRREEMGNSRRVFVGVWWRWLR
jgi:hypothetical protein